MTSEHRLRWTELSPAPTGHKKIQRMHLGKSKISAFI